MIELAGMSVWVSIIVLVVVAAVVSYGVTEVVKRVMSDYKTSHAKDSMKAGDRPWWWNSFLRVVAIAVGAGVGFLAVKTFIGVGIGMAAGVLNTTVVATVEDKIKSVASKLVEKIK